MVSLIQQRLYRSKALVNLVIKTVWVLHIQKHNVGISVMVERVSHLVTLK